MGLITNIIGKFTGALNSLAGGSSYQAANFWAMIGALVIQASSPLSTANFSDSGGHADAFRASSQQLASSSYRPSPPTPRIS